MGVDAGVVLVLGQLVGGIGAGPSSWAVAAATLAVSALFQPSPVPHPAGQGGPGLTDPRSWVTIPQDGKGMVEVGEAEKTEKITINLGLVDLGQIDLLVQEGFYANRTDFIRTAIRTQLATHAEAVTHTVARKTLVLGVQHYTRRDLEAIRAAGQRLQIRVLGLASIAEDVAPELALATIESVEVLGALRASAAVKAALADRIV